MKTKPFVVLIFGVALLAAPAPAEARPSVRAAVARIKSWPGAWKRSLRRRVLDIKKTLRPAAGASIQSYVSHCNTLKTGETFKLTEAKSKNGRVLKIKVPRQVAEVPSTSWGLRRYLSHVGGNTVELVYNQHSSEYGHMLVRAGRNIYEFRNVRSAKAASFSSVVAGRRGMVGMVYRVDRAKLPEIERQLAALVKATKAFNLPPFDSYGKPIPVKPAGQPDKAGFQSFVITTPAKGKYRASGKIKAKRVTIDGKPYLESPSGVRVAVVAEKKDGTLSVDTATCTSFAINTLKKLVPALGFDGLSSYAQRYARSAVTNIVRGSTTALPDLVTVYTPGRGKMNVKQVVWDIGKKK